MNSLNQLAVFVLFLIAGDVVASDWPMYRKDIGRTAVCQSEMPSDLTLRWTRQLPPLTPEIPWHGYSLGDWTDEWDRLAERAVAGDYIENGERSAKMRRSGIKPNTPVRDVLK